MPDKMYYFAIYFINVSVSCFIIGIGGGNESIIVNQFELISLNSIKIIRSFSFS